MAKSVKISVDHTLGATTARSRIENGFEQLSEKLGFGLDLNRSWNDYKLDFEARVLGQSITGKIDVRETYVLIHVNLPAVLGGMAESIQEKLTQESTKLLSNN